MSWVDNWVDKVMMWAVVGLDELINHLIIIVVQVKMLMKREMSCDKMKREDEARREWKDDWAR